MAAVSLPRPAFGLGFVLWPMPGWRAWRLGAGASAVTWLRQVDARQGMTWPSCLVCKNDSQRPGGL